MEWSYLESDLEAGEPVTETHGVHVDVPRLGDIHRDLFLASTFQDGLLSLYGVHCVLVLENGHLDRNLNNEDTKNEVLTKEVQMQVTSFQSFGH